MQISEILVTVLHRKLYKILYGKNSSKIIAFCYDTEN
jgi:hypothetical protein